VPNAIAMQIMPRLLKLEVSDKANYGNCNSVNAISKQSTRGDRANGLNRGAKS